MVKCPDTCLTKVAATIIRGTVKPAVLAGLDRRQGHDPQWLFHVGYRQRESTWARTRDLSSEDAGPRAPGWFPVVTNYYEIERRYRAGKRSRDRD